MYEAFILGEGLVDAYKYCLFYCQFKVVKVNAY